MTSTSSWGAEIHYGKPQDSLSSIGDIPLILTQHHHHVLPYWLSSGLKNSQLIHIDAHDDMGDYVQIDVHGKLHNLNIANFICPAMYFGAISQVYWVNPHSIVKRIQEFCFHKDNGQSNFWATKDNRNIIQWASILPNRMYQVYEDFKTVRKEIPLQFHKPYILDIDLDGFCCNKPESMDFITDCIDIFHDPITNYEFRIQETVSLLDTLHHKPDLITITRSIGGEVSYVPHDKVYDIEQLLLEKLKEIYLK